MIVMIFVISIFIVLGIFLVNGKGSFLIAGYNTMSAKEKEKYDKTELSKFMGKMMFVLAFSMILWVLSEVYGIDWLFVAGLILFIFITFFMVVYMNIGQKFRK
ncbi:DUF3784 domain-containing protein [Salinicoccus sp. Marseille-QA3877]